MVDQSVRGGVVLGNSIGEEEYEVFSIGAGCPILILLRILKHRNGVCERILVVSSSPNSKSIDLVDQGLFMRNGRPLYFSAAQRSRTLIEGDDADKIKISQGFQDHRDGISLYQGKLRLTKQPRSIDHYDDIFGPGCRRHVPWPYQRVVVLTEFPNFGILHGWVFPE